MDYLNPGTVHGTEGMIVLTGLFGSALMAHCIGYLFDQYIPSGSSVATLGLAVVSALGTAAAYFGTCHHFESKYYKKETAFQWKIQPNRWLTDALHREEVYTGTRNAAIGSFLGVLMIFGTQNKLYWNVADYGLSYYFLCYPLYFLWVEFFAYFAHRFHHTRFMYKKLHKQHHRYVAPTPYGAYAMHPIEFIIFVIGPLSVIYMVPFHVVPFFCNIIYIGFHAIVDHSGINFSPDLPFQASVRFHDDHHQYFHTNYGQSLVIFDYLFDTMYQKNHSQRRRAT